MHITSGEDGYACRHHICAVGINFDRVHWYHDSVDGDRDSDQDGLDDRDTCPCANCQSRIDYISQVQNSAAILAHPQSGHGTSFAHLDCDEGWSLADLKRCTNYTGVEIATGGDNWGPKWWDELLKMGKKVWAFGSDDCHSVVNNRKSFNRNWIVVNSALGPLSTFLDKREGELRTDILDNIKSGNFYTVMRSPDISGDTPGDGSRDIGPLIKLGVVGNLIVAWTDRESLFQFYSYPSNVGSVRSKGRFAVYKLERNAKYVRMMVEQRRPDGELYRALTQPLFVVTNSLQLHYNEPFALFVQGGKYVHYMVRNFGINLGWSDQAVYQWILRKEGLPHSQQGVAVQSGDIVALYNNSNQAHDYVVYGERDFGINLRWLRDQSTIPQDEPYNWKIEGTMPNSFSLRNRSINKCLIYESRPYGINLGWAEAARGNIMAVIH